MFSSGLPAFQPRRGRLRLLPLPSSCVSPAVLVHGKHLQMPLGQWFLLEDLTYHHTHKMRTPKGGSSSVTVKVAILYDLP